MVTGIGGSSTGGLPMCALWRRMAGPVDAPAGAAGVQFNGQMVLWFYRLWVLNYAWP
jgi:hypothetical protein